jgi:hypothetical protein
MRGGRGRKGEGIEEEYEELGLKVPSLATLSVLLFILLLLSLLMFCEVNVCTFPFKSTIITRLTNLLTVSFSIAITIDT